jgi:hypothetical protein
MPLHQLQNFRQGLYPKVTAVPGAGAVEPATARGKRRMIALISQERTS